MTKAHHLNTLRTQRLFTTTLVLLLEACNRHTTTKVAVPLITTAEARTLISKANQVRTARHRASTVLLKDSTVGSRCNTNRDRLHQVDITRTTGGMMVAEVADSLLDCARVWRVVVVWTACSRPEAMRAQH